MNVVFRVDASIEIGTGHVVRCLTLADALKDIGISSHFICRDYEGNLAKLIKEKGHKYVLLPLIEFFSRSTKSEELAHADWLGASQKDDAESCKSIILALKPTWVIVDHYGINEPWEMHIAEIGTKIFAVDDLADRDHYCDILLDQTIGRSDKDYESHVPRSAVILCGTKYSLLRPEFMEWRERSLILKRSGEIRRVFVNLGGVDKNNLTSTALKSLEETSLADNISVVIVLGEQCPNIQSVKKIAASSRFSTKVLVGSKNMAELMASADIAIGAAGTTSWERCCLGLPTLMLVVADNQRTIAANLAGVGAAQILSKTGLNCEIKSFFKTIKPNDILRMSKSASLVADGSGAIRVARIIAQGGLNAY
jgi:UDP-2,4-diacetamido-2,4,6-trideoxy-beta-L-altropyranose hydrolase